jgi:anti-sigma B factor antagonist
MMALKANVTSKGDVTIIRLDGRITLGDGSGTLRETVKNVFGSGATKVLIDLGGVDYIDSAGLGELVGCQASAMHKNAALKLVNLQKKVLGLMQITKLTVLFESFNDEPEALRSFGAGATTA